MASEDDLWRLVAASGRVCLQPSRGTIRGPRWAKVRQHRVTYFDCLGAMPTLLLRPQYVPKHVSMLRWRSAGPRTGAGPG
jgi:hypothetical protein